MKKFLLSLATVAMAGGMAFADTVTFDFVNKDYGLERSSNSYTKELTVLSESPASMTLNTTDPTGNGFRLWTDGLRSYKGTNYFQLSVKDAEITCITLAAPKTLGTCKINNETIAYSNKLYTWTGSTEVATVELVASANNAIASITIDYTVLTDKKPAELSFAKNEYNVPNTAKYFSEATLSNPNNLAVTYTSSDTSVAEITDLGIKINGEGSTVITATSEETDEFAAGKASYTLNVLPGVATVEQMLALTPDTKVLINTTLMVGFVNGSNIFVTDGDDWIQIYGSNSYKIGDVIPSGWVATYTLYNNTTPELTNGNLPDATSNAAQYLSYPTLTSITAADVNKVAYVVATFNAEVPSTKTNFEGVVDGETYTFRNNYSIEGVPAGTYKTLVVVTIYDNKPSLYTVSYEEYAEDPELPESIVVTTNSTAAIVNSNPLNENEYYITITGQAEKNCDTIDVTLETPEGWDGFLLYTMDDDITILSSAAAKVAPEWANNATFPGQKSNMFTATADGFGYDVMGYLYKDDKYAENALISISVKVKKGETVGVDEVEAAEVAAEYYTLDGVKVENPANGIFLKVAGEKVEKVVIK